MAEVAESNTDQEAAGTVEYGGLITTRLKERIPQPERLSPKYKKIADYLLRHPEDAALRTAADLANEIGVSEATVIRFSNVLSYAGYAEFQRDFQQMVRDELGTVRRLGRSLDRGSRTSALEIVVEEEVANLSALIRQVPSQEIRDVARLLVRAKHVWVVGLRGEACLAQYFAYQIRWMKPRVSLITRGGVDSMEGLSDVKGGIIIAFSFPRYVRELIQIVDYARDSGVQEIVAITDGISSPLAERAGHRIYVSSSPSGLVDLHGAAMAVAAAVVHEAGVSDERRALSGLTRYEKFATQSRLYLHPKEQ